MRVIRSSAARKNAIIGRAFFAICITGTSVSELATNRLTPIGGVTNPMARLTTMITPNWIGFIPIACTIGSRIGVRIRIAGVVSMIIPTISRKRLMISRIAIGLWKMLEKEYIDSWYTSFAAGAVLISIPIAILFLCMQRFYVDGVSGAVKG